MYIGLHVKYPISQTLMKLESSCQIFEKNSIISNLKNIYRLGAESFHADRQRDGRTEGQRVVEFERNTD